MTFLAGPFFFCESAAKPFLQHLFPVSFKGVQHTWPLYEKNTVTIISLTQHLARVKMHFCSLPLQRIHPEIIYFMVLLFTPIKTT